MPITKALLLYKIFPVSLISTSSALFLYLKTTTNKPTGLAFNSDNQLNNSDESRVLTKVDEDSDISIKEYHPTFNDQEIVDFVQDTIPIRPGNDLETLSLFNFSASPTGSPEKFFDEIFSVSIDKLKLDLALSNKTKPYILLSFYFNIKGDLWASQSGAVEFDKKTIVINHLLDTKWLMESNQNIIDTAQIKVKGLELNLALQIKNFRKSETIEISLVNIKEAKQLVGTISKTNPDAETNPLSEISFQYFESSLLYKTLPLNESVETYIPSTNKSGQFKSDPGTFIRPRLDFNKTDAISKNWISPTFSLGGFVEDRDNTRPQAKYYIKKGNGTTNYKILEKPEDVLKVRPTESIFTTTENNPEKYGGYIADVLAEEERPTKTRMQPTLKPNKTEKDPINDRYDNKWSECISQKPAKSLCEHHDVYVGVQKDLGSIEYFDHQVYKEKFTPRRSFTDAKNEHMPYDEATPPQGIHPFIARQLLTAEEKYKDTNWKLPQLAKQYHQAILEQSTKPIKSKEYKAHVESLVDKDKEITFPAYFLRTAHFWEQERDSQEKNTEAPNNHYSTNHQLAMQIHLDDWQKYLLENDQFGQANIPSKEDPTLRSGFNITTPITAEFQDTSFNSSFKKSFNVSVFVNLESLKNNNEFTYTYSLIYYLHTHYNRKFLSSQDDYDRPNKHSGLELISKMIVKVFLDSNKNINITYDFPIDRFLQHVKTVCDFRDFDREEAIKHAVLSECPNYYKLPGLFSLTIHEAPTVAPYWYVNQASTESMASYLNKDKLDEREMTKTKFLEGADRQTRVIANLKPNKSKEDGVVEKYVTTPGWLSSTYDRFVSFFNYSIPQTSKAPNAQQQKEHWTSFEAQNLTPGAKLIVGLESPDASTTPLTINSRHPFSTKLSVWTNTDFKEDEGDRTHKAFDKQNYKTEELDKNPNDVFQSQASPVELTIDPEMISENINSPTWIPYRMALNLNSAKKYEDIKDHVENLFVYMCQEDQEIKASDIKECKTATTTIKEWSNKDPGLKALDDKKFSFVFLNFGFFISKTVDDKKTTFKIKSKLWGASFSNVLNSKQEVRDYGAEGSAGMQLSHLRISKTN